MKLIDDTWPMPVLLGALSLGGLAAGIFGDGAWDALCWVGLGVPVAVTAAWLWRQWREPGQAPRR